MDLDEDRVIAGAQWSAVSVGESRLTLPCLSRSLSGPLGRHR